MTMSRQSLVQAIKKDAAKKNIIVIDETVEKILENFYLNVFAVKDEKSVDHKRHQAMQKLEYDATIDLATNAFGFSGLVTLKNSRYQKLMDFHKASKSVITMQDEYKKLNNSEQQEKEEAFKNGLLLQLENCNEQLGALQRKYEELSDVKIQTEHKNFIDKYHLGCAAVYKIFKEVKELEAEIQEIAKRCDEEIQTMVVGGTPSGTPTEGRSVTSTPEGTPKQTPKNTPKNTPDTSVRYLELTTPAFSKLLEPVDNPRTASASVSTSATTATILSTHHATTFNRTSVSFVANPTIKLDEKKEPEKKKFCRMG